MIQLRPSKERGHFDHGWLKTYHTFSFADYFDRNHMNFRTLRVINEDTVAPGQGFGMHSHRDMEILTYILDGTIEHQDSLGNKEQIKPGEIQRMTAGTGVTHSEYNPSASRPLHLLQIWILPEKKDLPPGYEQKKIEEVKNRFVRIASPEPGKNEVKIHQDANVYLCRLEKDRQAELALAKGRHAWVQIARGGVLMNEEVLRAGDGAGISDEPKLVITANQDSEVLVFDLA
jgi:quercetin 2,3-dioxygenase